jgi:hypothetical protein
MMARVRNSASASVIAGVLALLSIAGNAMAADLIGTVLQGSAPLANVSVKLKYDGADAGSATSDAAGRFIIRNLRPGVYEMQCGDKTALKVRISDGLNEINCQV